MRLLLDQGLPRSTVLYLQNYGIEAVHVGDRGVLLEPFVHVEGKVLLGP